MYAWIWRKLPFGLPGKLTGSLVIAASVVALLWFVVFPWAEPILPFDDVQVNTDSGVPGQEFEPGQTPGTDVTGDPGDDFEVPYDTASNNPAPPSR